MAAAKQYKDYKSAKNRDKAKVKKYSKGMSKEDITQEGKRGIAAGKALGESLRDKNAPMKRQRLADRQPIKKKNILDKFTDKLNKAGEAYKKLGGAGLNVLRGNTKGQPFPAKKMVGGMAKKYSVGGGADMGKKNKKSKSGSSVKDIFKSYGKYDGKPIELSKGGGADTGRMGEMKSKLSVAMDRASRRSRDKDRLTTRDKEEAINIIKRRSRNEDRITNRDIESASSAIKGYKSGGKTKKLKDDYFKVLGVFPTVKKKMGGGMMQRPMGYKKGTMVKARGCKLGRSKPTKMY
jgi:hypothetical protein